MPYNYTREFLAANRDLLHSLVDLAERRRYQVIKYETPREAMAMRFRVNNLLASLAIHEPGMAWIRQSVRTWLRYQNEYWLLHVGVPPADVTIMGATPKAKLGQPYAVEAPSDSRLPPVLVIEEITRENSAEVFLQLAEAKTNPKVQEVRIAVPPVQAGVEYLIEKLAPEFGTDAPTAKPLVFQRKAGLSTS